MRFKDFILEKPMNMKTFADVGNRLGNTARVGFEFEMIVPTNSGLYSGDEKDTRDSQIISYYDSLDEFYELFDMSRAEFNTIEREYEGWVDNSRDEHEENTWESYLDQDEEDDDLAELNARSAAHHSFDPDKDHTFKDWIKTTFGTNYDFVMNFDLEPKYGWYDESSRYASVYTEEREAADSFASTAAGVKYSLDRIVDSEIIIIDNYHGNKKSSNNWYIEPDASIEPSKDEDDVGIEIVSPPMVLNKALKVVDDIFKWMQDNILYTNTSTGLHINISIPDLAMNLDPVKLVLFMGENHAARLFNRLGNSYAKSQIDQIFLKVKMNGLLPAAASDMQKTAKEYLSQNKYQTVNLGHLTDGYLEFRVAGGSNYEKNIDAIKKIIYRFVLALEIACDPKAERNEYLKKLVKLFDKAGVEALNVKRSDIEQLPKELHRLYKLSTDIKPMYHNAFELSFPESKRNSTIALANMAVAVTYRFRTALDIKEKVFIKKMLLDVNVKSKDVDDFLDTQSADRLRFKKEYGI